MLLSCGRASLAASSASSLASASASPQPPVLLLAFRGSYHHFLFRVLNSHIMPGLSPKRNRQQPTRLAFGELSGGCVRVALGLFFQRQGGHSSLGHWYHTQPRISVSMRAASAKIQASAGPHLSQPESPPMPRDALFSASLSYDVLAFRVPNSDYNPWLAMRSRSPGSPSQSSPTISERMPAPKRGTACQLN
jgi:hypothetical protein